MDVIVAAPPSQEASKGGRHSPCGRDAKGPQAEKRGVASGGGVGVNAIDVVHTRVVALSVSLEAFVVFAERDSFWLEDAFWLKDAFDALLVTFSQVVTGPHVPGWGSGFRGRCLGLGFGVDGVRCRVYGLVLVYM